MKKCRSEFGNFTRHRWDKNGVCGRCKKECQAKDSSMFVVTWPKKSKTRWARKVGEVTTVGDVTFVNAGAVS